MNDSDNFERELIKKPLAVCEEIYERRKTFSSGGSLQNQPSQSRLVLNRKPNQCRQEIANILELQEKHQSISDKEMKKLTEKGECLGICGVRESHPSSLQSSQSSDSRVGTTYNNSAGSRRKEGTSVCYCGSVLLWGNTLPCTSDYIEIRVKHIIELNVVTTELIVEFAKELLGFDFAVQDHVTLLKRSTSEVMILRAARKYVIETDTIILANKKPYTREYLSAFMGDFTESLFNFCRNMSDLEVNDGEYALLSAIVIFSECSTLRDPEKVLLRRDSYISALKSYVSVNRPAQKKFFDKLMVALGEVAVLGEKYLNIPVNYFPPRLGCLDPPMTKCMSLDPQGISKRL